MEVVCPFIRRAGGPLEWWRFQIGSRLSGRPRTLRICGSKAASAMAAGVRLMDETERHRYPQVVLSPSTGGKISAPVYEN
jgi:hypothetical protein